MKKKATILLILICFIIILGAIVGTKPFINRYFCVGCGDCVKHCPVSAITLVSSKAVIDQTLCINCGLCLKTCNYQAVRRPK
jgi:ferredoxin